MYSRFGVIYICAGVDFTVQNNWNSYIVIDYWIKYDYEQVTQTGNK